MEKKNAFTFIIVWRNMTKHFTAQTFLLCLPLLCPKHSLWLCHLSRINVICFPFYRRNCDYIKDGIGKPLFLSIDTQRSFFIFKIQLLPFRLRHGLCRCCLITHSVCFRGLSAKAECHMKLQSSATDWTTSTAKPGWQTQRVYRKICG